MGLAAGAKLAPEAISDTPDRRRQSPEAQPQARSVIYHESLNFIGKN